MHLPSVVVNGSASAAEAAALAGALGVVADQLGSRGAVAQYEADIADPERTRKGTAFADSTGPLPRFLPMRDIVRISFNILDMLPAEAILQRLARSTRIPTDDNLTNTLPYAPTLEAALALGTRYGNAMLPWFSRGIERSGGNLTVVYTPVAPLGRLEPVSTELHLVSTHRVVETIVGPRAAGARINFAAPPVSDPADIAGRLGCAVTVGGGMTFISVPLSWSGLRSPYHDAILWEDGTARCEADIRMLQAGPGVCQVRNHVLRQLDSRKAPTVEDTATAIGLSVRSLVRMLTEAGTTHHRIVDFERQQKARLLLAQPDIKLAEVAERLGFPDRSSFGRKCRLWFGESPARLRQCMVAGQLR